MQHKFNPQPKPQKKVKVKDNYYWWKLRRNSALKSIEKNKKREQKDKEFYQSLYDNLVKNNNLFCENCGKRLTQYPKSDTDFHKKIRFYFHHILPKSRYKHLRYKIENICVLCKSCHSKAESAISYPKMNI